MTHLTIIQSHYLHAIIDLTRELGMPPTMREIGVHLGVKSTNAISQALMRLERQGLIRRKPKTARGCILTPAGKEWENRYL